MISPEASDPLNLYELIEKVGEGSYGEIYRAMSKNGPQIVALKIIDLEKTEDDIEDLLTEVDFQAKCDSPYLAKYYGSWMWENKLTISMEFLSGGTLEDLLADFGVAAQMTTGKAYRDTFVGTPLYLAPEIITSEKYDTKVDIWSLGVMGIEIATGFVPRRDQHPMDVNNN
ncbi:Serine/threonine-protein kinase 24 [Clydaea vesicula]|uniref:non-specific serine/threonine protein kinase n=1 Tax=Clydaea vesicula TaxID=447962 RepID=A0AAD5XRM8_9FUNG|nr:Serine/threonine-protein kinase 24 [Clydaea vesicula]